MKNLFIGLFVILGSLFVVHGCNSVSQNMSTAQRLYASKCTSCHMLIEPSAFDEKAWQVYVHRYGEHLTEDEKRVLWII
jgi:hypothetical protein